MTRAAQRAGNLTLAQLQVHASLQLNHYQTLGVSSDAKHDAIRGAYRSLAVKHHPDKGGDPLLFQAIQEAYEVLGDETKRREYNASFRKKPVESLSETAARMVDEFITAC